MSELRARVRNGHLVLDEPTDLPEGTVLYLVVDDEGDDIDDEKGAALNAAIALGLDTARAGRVRSAADVLADLRSKR